MTRRETISPIKEDGPLDSSFEKLVKKTLESWHVPGVSIAVIDGSQTWTKGYGLASLPSTPVTPSTLFYTGSTTKAFTASILSLLVSDNANYPEIQWTTPIADLIRSDFVLENEYATTHLTIEDALSHRTGLPGHDRSIGGPNCTIQSVVRSLRYLPMTAEPRTRYMYCNAMFIVATHMIETVTGRKLGELMKEWIWEPLGMESTFFSLASAKNSKNDLATGYRFLYGQEEGGFETVDWVDNEVVSGAGAVISNVLDYAKWAKSIIDQSTPLSKSGFQALFTPRMLMPVEEPFTGPRAYALGWRTGVYQGQRFFEHSGGVDGFGAQLLIFPDMKYAAVSLANTAGTANFVDLKLCYHLVDEKMNVPVQERFRWDKKFQKTISQGKALAGNAMSVFYPHIPTPPLPLTLPLVSYSGKYSHPAYGTLTISLSFSPSAPSGPKQLRADRSDQILPQKLSFEHASGEYFVVRGSHVGDFGALFDDVYPAEFRIGGDGRVSCVGIGWEEEMWGMKRDEGKIWLRRVEE